MTPALRRAAPAFAAVLVAVLAAAPVTAKHDDGPAPGTPLGCLARAVYFEARGQSDREMSAVAHVVLNRVAHEDFPDAICKVVREGGETPPCQFSWWCDGRSDVAADEEEHARAVRIARDALEGRSADPTDGANMFHNRSVRPPWTKRAEGRGQIGAQLFYRLDPR
jgi:spore germination cell wall hydrolase CwlJ-like protein